MDESLRAALERRLHQRAIVQGTMALPAVPAMLEEYVALCDRVFRGIGVTFSEDQLDQLRDVLKAQLEEAFAATSRSEIVITYDSPAGLRVNYHVRAQWSSVDAAYDSWVATREPPLFGSEPDARVWAIATEVADPALARVLDLGAGTGRNALALARRGHPVDAVEVTPAFAESLRDDAARESLPVRVIQRDLFDGVDDLRDDYSLVILSEVASDFRTVDQLRRAFEIASRCLAPGGRFVMNVFLPRGSYVPDAAALELGQQCYTSIVTRPELEGAVAGLPLEWESDTSVHDYEQAHLPTGAWPPTGWYERWVSGQDVFDVEREDSPIDMRWLVFRKTG
ncbi:MAG: class I SAM-dependent methyltransferase [Candidatus Nanopelagicales bacterium]